MSRGISAPFWHVVPAMIDYFRFYVRWWRWFLTGPTPSQFLDAAPGALHIATARWMEKEPFRDG